MSLLGHTGHWISNVAYFAPIVGFLVWLGITNLREHRAGEPRTRLRDLRKRE